ncbi:MAG: NAD(P)H-dependent oxidoreductase [Marinibacterium sp.]|nr:NAD(P)H-dependent oxidoreductase [Marinibacterium sp.]
MSTQLTLLGLSGSLRAGATNTLLLREAARLFDPAQFVQGDLRLPLYDGDLEAAHGLPPEVDRLVEQIAAADAVIISTPEYNKGPSGVLKNALDWVSRHKAGPWRGKPVAVMSAAAGRAGGERAQMVLRGFMNPFQPHVIPGPEMHLGDSGNEFDDHGQLKSDRYLRTLSDLMTRLRAEAERNSA